MLDGFCNYGCPCGYYGGPNNECPCVIEPSLLEFHNKMDTVEFFYDFLRKIGAPNFLAIGIAVIVLWLLISGVRKGLKEKKKTKTSKTQTNENVFHQ